jgi:hypothetical protein
MAIRFNLDGTVTNIPEPPLQEVLEIRLKNFEDNIQLKFVDLRRYRDQALSNSDWTLGSDSPLTTSQKTSWIEYRQKLRDLPSHPNAPDRFIISDWPMHPGQTEILQEAKVFIAEISDPVGIGTTSWVGINEDGEYVDLMPPPPELEPEVNSESEE